MKRILLHVCCGPCSTHTIKELQKDYHVTLFFYNPNIHPFGEYVRRMENAKRVGEFYSVKFIEGEYSVTDWLDMITGFEEEPEGGKRCTICFADRLSKTARYAKDNGFDCFTTTISISPHKNSKTINELGERIGEKYDIEWVHSDFKKKDGFKKSTEISKELNLYRQKYCGCFYSVRKLINNNEDIPDLEDS